MALLKRDRMMIMTPETVSQLLGWYPWPAVITISMMHAKLVTTPHERHRGLWTGDGATLAGQIPRVNCGHCRSNTTCKLHWHVIGVVTVLNLVWTKRITRNLQQKKKSSANTGKSSNLFGITWMILYICYFVKCVSVSWRIPMRDYRVFVHQ